MKKIERRKGKWELKEPELDKGVQKFEKVEKVMKRYPLVRSNFGNNRGDHLFIIYPL